MATHVHQHKGRTVTITATEDQGRWYWSYSIGGGERVDLNDRGLPDEETCVDDARRDAQRRIDAEAP
jgi:hypothetical protein